VRGGNPNLRYGNIGGGGYKRGQDERDGHGEQRDVNAGRIGAGGA
jgi:hypothetical protein